ncbi:hypothetical protein A1359_20000 [Methylomonas lenta]|uniref:PEP-CTERM protein-sorting domain-containing protein n=1 Tax=Methylomonas lenta TaxID=980561 RepID=A0A177NTR2_9GAMM|nr:hypothetical protein [Methylomonas lenta]OAI20944.1 hypothetical protein A1359_20000 [Methylomonas lenta]
MKINSKMIFFLMVVFGQGFARADTVYVDGVPLFVLPISGSVLTTDAPAVNWNWICSCSYSDSVNIQSVDVGFNLSEPRVQSEPGRGNIRVGDIFDIDLIGNGLLGYTSRDDLILGFGFNTKLTGVGGLQFLGSTINPLFDDSSADVGLDAAGFAFPGLDVNAIGSTFSLATLHFQALSAGSASIAVVSDLADFNQGLFFLDQGAISIDSSLNLNVAAVPLPPSAVLFISAGLFTVIGRRKKSL